MAKVQVSFLAELRIMTRSKSVEVTVEEGETIRTLLSKLSERFGEGFRRVVFESEAETRKNVIIRQNGENIATKKGLETPVMAGDLIVIMPAVAGG